MFIKYFPDILQAWGCRSSNGAGDGGGREEGGEECLRLRQGGQQGGSYRSGQAGDLQQGTLILLRPLFYGFDMTSLICAILGCPGSQQKVRSHFHWRDGSQG